MADDEILNKIYVRFKEILFFNTREKFTEDSYRVEHNGDIVGIREGEGEGETAFINSPWMGWRIQ